MRKILIATPIRGGVSSTYLEGFVGTVTRTIADVQLEHCVLDGPSVNFARNECAHYAKKIGAREIVFIDEDMGWTTDNFLRLISHENVDVVAGLYCKRKPGAPHWLLNLTPGAAVDPVTQLCQADRIATGFMKIRVDTVLAAIEAKYPEREYYNKPEDGSPVTAFEYFPMGVVGPRSAEARLAKVKAILGKDALPLTHFNLLNVANAILQAIEEPHEPGNLLGEDYYFCQLVRDCGFKIFADFGLPPIGHIGRVAFPITPAMVGLDNRKATVADAVDKPILEGTDTL